MAFNRRSLFGRLIAACGLPMVTRAQPVHQTRSVADFTLPIKHHETVFGTVDFHQARMAALLRKKRDLEITLLSSEDNPHGYSSEELEARRVRASAYTSSWLVPETHAA